MIDLLQPLSEDKISEILRHSKASRIVAFDWSSLKPKLSAEQLKEYKKKIDRDFKERKKLGLVKSRGEARIERQKWILDALRNMPESNVYTAGQIGHMLRIGNGEQTEKDMEPMFQRGELSRQEIRTKRGVVCWAYWVQK